jgi:hypothetical protein
VREEQEQGELPIAAGQTLARLLSRENRVSDFIAFLAALDPEPFLAALNLPAQEVCVKREGLLGKRSERADLVVRDANGSPIALLEIKTSAAQHGDQFDRYDRWAKAQARPPTCYLIALDGEALSPPEGWRVQPMLPQLLRCWTDSRDPHAAWLSAAAASVLDGWATQADGKLGNASGPIVGDLVARKISVGLLADGNPRTGFGAYPTRDFGGAAMVFAYQPFPGQPQEPGAWLCADLRSKFRDRPEAPWQLRLGVEVKISDQVTPAKARTTAHDLAMSIRGSLTCTAVTQALREAGQPQLAAALRPKRSSRDGLVALNEETRGEWRVYVETRADGRHPLLVHDNVSYEGYRGYRLFSLIEVNVSALDWRQLATLVRTALAHIETHAL